MYFKYFLNTFISCLVLLLFPCVDVKATHLMGGEITYQYGGSISGGTFYDIKLIVYRYCDETNGVPAALDPEMFLGVYVDDPANPAGSKLWYNTEILTLLGSTFVTSAPGNSNCPFQPTACIEMGEYLLTVLLPDNIEGYHLFVERCCRNGNILNITNPGAAGMSYYAFIPPAIINSSPQISDVSVPYICVGDTISIINNAYDPDGDSLAYSFVTPFNGNSNQTDPAPDPIINSPYLFPIVDVSYAPTYSQTAMFGPGGFASIDPITGLTRYYIPNQGFYVAAIEIREYRNGVLISSIRRDLQFITIVCTPNDIPVMNTGTTNNVYTVAEGQQICFNVNFTDADGDSLFLVPTGPLLDGTITIPPGIIATASGSGTVSSQFCWTPVCGMSRPSAYQFSVTVTDNGCPQKTSSQIFSVYVTAGASSLTPTVSIIQTPPGILCQGSLVTLHAVPYLGGSSPVYSWSLNGNPTGVTDSLYTPSNLVNGDIVSVSMVSNATCLVTNTANSSPYVANINSQPGPQVTITSNPPANLCPQQICLFTANISNGGATPSFQWNINGLPAGTNNYQFTAANPSGLMSVYVTLTPSTGCPPTQSNNIVFNIQPNITPQLALTADIFDSICPGQEVVFSVESSSLGSTPVYNWFINGISQGINSDTLILSNLQDGDFVHASVTSSYPCLAPDFAYGDPLYYYLYPSLQGDLTDGPLELCYGQPVELSMSASGGQNDSYVYSWSHGSSVTSQNNFIPQNSGYYYSNVSDICSYSADDSVYIDVLPVPVADFTWTPQLPTVFTPLVQFNDASIDAISWNWNLGEQTESTEQNPVHEYSAGGFFPIRLITTNDVGCTDTLVKMLEVENYITSYIPNSFTPNGDGRNDEFGLIGFSTGGYSMSVFNRWGQEIFSTEGGYKTWNGEDENGKLAPEGSYIYLVKITNDKTQKPITGTVTLIR